MPFRQLTESATQQCTAHIALPACCNFAYSALASFRMGMSGSAPFQRVRKSCRRRVPGRDQRRLQLLARFLPVRHSRERLQMRQRSRPAVPDDAAVVENLLKLGGGGGALSTCQVCLSAYVHMIEAGMLLPKKGMLPNSMVKA